MSQTQGVQSQIPDEDETSEVYAVQVTPDSQGVVSEREANIERAQAHEQKRQLEQMWRRHRDELYAIVEQYLHEVISDPMAGIQETRYSIKVPSLYLQVRSSPIGIQIIWLDPFKEKKVRNIFEAKELEEFLYAREEQDWYQDSLSLGSDRRPVRQVAHEAEPKPDIRWRYAGYAGLVIASGMTLFLLIMLMGT